MSNEILVDCSLKKKKKVFSTNIYWAWIVRLRVRKIKTSTFYTQPIGDWQFGIGNEAHTKVKMKGDMKQCWKTETKNYKLSKEQWILP